MENLETETLYLHEGHEDEFGEEDDMAMDEDHPMWRSERITLNSVGIDIGSSTSHLIFSRLTLRRQGIALSSHGRQMAGGTAGEIDFAALIDLGRRERTRRDLGLRHGVRGADRGKAGAQSECLSQHDGTI